MHANDSVLALEGARPKTQWFADTHWSVVMAASHASQEQRAAALEILCRTYWEPLYAYLRNLGKSRDDAQDLTQAFLARLVTRNPFARLSPERGKFRSFLIKSLQHFLADQNDRELTAKRGGGHPLIPLDLEMAETHHAQGSGNPTSPEVAFDRRWAVTLLNRAFAALQQEFLAGDKATQFAELSVFLALPGNSDEYSATASKLQMTSGAVAVAVHRLRARYRECIRSEVAQTVLAPEEVEDEMRYLLEVLCQ